jgi:hypothetical protein
VQLLCVKDAAIGESKAERRRHQMRAPRTTTKGKFVGLIARRPPGES